MNARAPRGGAALVVALGALVSGCLPRVEPSVLDAGVALDAPRPSPRDAPRLDALDAPDVVVDAPPFDAYDPRRCVTFEPGTFGSPCRAGGTCDEGLTCGLSATTSVRALDGTTFDLALGDGVCTTRCDPHAARPCECGICVTSWPVGTGRASIVDALGHGVCVQPCFPDVPGGRPECNGPYGCDSFGGGCLPACASDEECLYTSIPGALAPRFAALADQAPLPITCNLARGECLRREPVPAPPLGARCASDTECALGHVCFAAVPGAPGTCARLSDCAEVGCGPVATCVRIQESVRACAAAAP